MGDGDDFSVGTVARLLLVEADLQTRALFSKALQMLHFSVDEALSLEQALTRVAEDQRYDCAVVNLGLPDGDGCDLVPFLRRTKPPTGVVVLSDDRLTARRMLELEAHALLLHKPVRIDELVEAIRRRLPSRPLIGAEDAFAAKYRLSIMERKVLASLQHPGTRAERARCIGCRPSTFAKHLQNIFAKTNLRSSAQLADAILMHREATRES
jgi:DNA-binding response OmpR family regulator